jgi:hypothetical protein
MGLVIRPVEPMPSMRVPSRYLAVRVFCSTQPMLISVVSMRWTLAGDNLTRDESSRTPMG